MSLAISFAGDLWLSNGFYKVTVNVDLPDGSQMTCIEITALIET
jgi:hypothetical protein